MYLLDTNVVSELRKPRPHGAVLAWFDLVDESHLHLSAVTLGEIQAGIELTRHRDPDKAAEIDRWTDQVSVTYNVLPMDAESVPTMGSIHAPEVRRPDRRRDDRRNGARASANGRDAKCVRLQGVRRRDSEPLQDQ